jgi:hypothetical protein
MAYFMGGLALVFLGAGIGLTIWVAKLKDAISGLEVALGNRNAIWIEAGNQISSLRDERAVLQAQLEVLRGKYNEVLTKIESGAYCSADDIAAALRGGPR